MEYFFLQFNNQIYLYFNFQKINYKKGEKVKVSVIIAFIAIGLASCQTEKTKSDLKTQKDSVSYAIGLDIGKNIKNNQLEVTPEILTQGILDSYNNKTHLLTDADVQKVMMAFQQEMMAKQQSKMKEQCDSNKYVGKKFLDENKNNKGIVCLPDGLQYQVIKSGNGKSPKLTDKVKAHYIGTLINGAEFDNSVKRGEPAVFPLNGVIKGWQEALQLMKVGDKWKIFIPSDLGYGDSGAGQQIPPGSTLIFEVELLGIEK